MKYAKRPTNVSLKLRLLPFLLLSFAAITASAQSPTTNQGTESETRVRGYWVDPSTGLMWAGHDSGVPMTWHKADSYCKKLGLAGYSDWRLATLDELASLVDKSDLVPVRVGNAETFSINVGRHVRGNLLLRGDPWSSNRDKNRFGHPFGDGAFFDFIYSKPSWDLQDFRNTKYALCIRRPLVATAPSSNGAIASSAQSSTDSQSSPQETRTCGYWIDPATGLMWAARDNRKDVSWKGAEKYCRNLRLAGYSNWRLPSADELERIYDGSDFTAPHPKDVIPILAGRANGGLLLTGAREWSSSRVLDDRGHNTGYAGEYDFPHGTRWKDPLGYKGSLRALCVRFPR